MNMITKIKELNFPPSEYVVIGSGILGALHIRDINDIDISVTKDFHKKLRETGMWKEDERYGKIFLTKENIEINPELNWEHYTTTTEEAIRSAQIIDSIPFMNLDELCKFKMALGREKDFEDIKLIKKYQNK